MPQKYDVIVEYFTIKIASNNVDLKLKQITLNKNIEYIPIIIQRIKLNNKKNVLQQLEPKGTIITYNDIINYYNNHIKNVNDDDENICIAPCYVTNTIIILGVINFKLFKCNNNIKLIDKTIIESLLCISPINLEKPYTKDYNILASIIYNDMYRKNLLSKTIIINDIHIKWEYIIRNIMNYLPKFNIYIKPSENFLKYPKNFIMK